MAKPSDVVGWYDLSWSGGTFQVCVRPAGVFFCPKFQQPSKWEMEGDILKIDWKKFGKYEMKFDPSTKSMEGNAIPKSDDEKNWRKATFVRDISPVEALLLGDGAGTEWDFQWSGGSFPVKFKADGYNHFQCDDFPAHAHWSLDGDTLKINWAQFGNYELKVDAAAKTMDGCSVGGDPAKDWRKASWLRNMISDATIADAECQHHH
mmetsp:Transcript_45361/g.81579  ORF Transcript_45361/g.81579 Transcript_45361/m.81579 type:complete len:206 (+) Transcript_45361:116-733(+)|eukprot:CAMPEP_0197663294 /NCGR_PEP_ID=MMETSP1338-20131121/56880_1 /TAXON_ID=43686 ORGANISM="Pelagodinium beii, Strain RCC1491" /NCGR_SAMPLE_ID=MMETSP1338 /ASSEMBLY_ACC=CAM_ASM_000754 /LENGTH=205 /DNA_ID=CAMNT_0043241591 /DNA_START=104 /DNA_END=721 /DNA_ORIENTATION=-